MNRRPIVFDPLLGECCELDLDAIARLCDVYHLKLPVCWGALHAATLDERLRRTQLMRTRPGGISAPPTRITIPILKSSPARGRLQQFAPRLSHPRAGDSRGYRRRLPGPRGMSRPRGGRPGVQGRF